MSRFNFNTKCAHPRIVKRLVTEFLQEATSLPCKVRLIYGRGQGFNTYLRAEDKFDNEIVIEYDYRSLNDSDWATANIEFNRDFHRKSNGLTKGFSSLTLSLLHELGHNETLGLLSEDFNRVTEILKCHEQAGEDTATLNRLYFEIEDERKATEWAIKWLSNAENRRKAKAFEKAFFEAWRG